VEACLSLIEKSPTRPDIEPIVYTEIGLLFFSQGRPTAAELYYGKAAELLVAQGSTDDTAAVVNLMLLQRSALLKKEQGNFEEAEESLLEIRGRLQSVATERSPDLPMLYNELDLADTYKCWHRMEEALKIYNDIKDKAVPKDVLAWAYMGMADVYAEEKVYHLAERYYQDALIELRHEHEPGSRRITEVFVELSKVYERQGKNDDAQAAYSTYLEAYDAEYGPDSLPASWAAYDMARFLHIRRAQPLAAAVFYERALSVVTAELGADSKQVRIISKHYDICKRAGAMVRARMSADGCTEAEAIARIFADNHRNHRR